MFTKWRRLTLTLVLIALIHAVAPSSWDRPLELLAILVGVYEASGLKFLTAGLLGTVLLFCVLRQIVAFGGPIPLTPAVWVGLNLWLAFLVVATVHTPIDALLHASRHSAS